MSGVSVTSASQILESFWNIWSQVSQRKEPLSDFAARGPGMYTLGSFSNNDGDGNQDVKKAIGLLRKTPTLHVHHAFLYISSPSLHDYDVKMPNYKFYGGRKQVTTSLFFSV